MANDYASSSSSSLPPSGYYPSLSVHQTTDQPIINNHPQHQRQITPGAETEQVAITMPDPSPLLLTPSSTGKSRYVPLYLAALEGDWESVEAVFNNDKDKLGASITEFGETTLHIASGAKRTEFVQKIVTKMNTKQLRMKNYVGDTALCFAAVSGVKDIAEAMVNRDKELLSICDTEEALPLYMAHGSQGALPLYMARGSQGALPLYMAALLGHKAMVKYLYTETKDKLNDDDCDGLLVACLSSDLYDLAYEVLRKHSPIAIPKDWRNCIDVQPQIRDKDETQPKSDAGKSQYVKNNDAKQKNVGHQTSLQSAGDQLQSLKKIDVKPSKTGENQTIFRFDIRQPQNEKNKDGKLKNGENETVLRIDFSQPQSEKSKDGELKNGENKTDFRIDISQPQNEKKKDLKPKDGGNHTAFHVLAKKQQAYESGNQLSRFESFIYNYFSEDELDYILPPENYDESHNVKKEEVSAKLKFFHVIISRVQYLKDICYQRTMHTKVLKLLRKISKETLSPDNPKIDNAISNLVPLLFKAAELGIIEFLVVLIQSYPDFFWKVNKDGHTIFHIAVIHRQEKVFSLIHEFGALKDYIFMLKDNDRNNMLHLAAIPQPQSRLKVDSGAALQLRKDQVWFKEVEKLMQPSYKDMENKDGKTPKSLFTEKHKKLVKAGGKWVKSTSSSCMLVSTLIATVMFAALFNVPGGNNPISHNEISFLVFAISDSASLICSAASILTFLSILTSRCAEQDFERSLPHRLLIGLIVLLFSLASMMVAFGATLFMVLGHELQWFTVVVFVGCFICVVWFTWLHLSLLKDIASDEYKSNKLFQTPMNLFEKSKKKHVE